MRYVLCSLLVLFATGLAAGAESPPQKLKSVMLQDVQGLTGGQSVYITEEGAAWVQIVRTPKAHEIGLQEERFKADLAAAERDELAKLLAKNGFWNQTSSVRPGVPDEARPTITAVTDLNTHSVARWANDRTKEFDAVYEALKTVAKKTAASKPVFAGKYDPSWKPAVAADKPSK